METVNSSAAAVTDDESLLVPTDARRWPNRPFLMVGAFRGVCTVEQSNAFPGLY